MAPTRRFCEWKAGSAKLNAAPSSACSMNGSKCAFQEMSAVAKSRRQPIGNTPSALACSAMPTPSCRRLFWHSVRRDDSRAAWMAGSNSATSAAMIATTTSSSTRVNPRKHVRPTWASHDGCRLQLPRMPTGMKRGCEPQSCENNCSRPLSLAAIRMPRVGRSSDSRAAAKAGLLIRRRRIMAIAECFRGSSSVTAAGPSRNCTGFPVSSASHK